MIYRYSEIAGAIKEAHNAAKDAKATAEQSKQQVYFKIYINLFFIYFFIIFYHLFLKEVSAQKLMQKNDAKMEFCAYDAQIRKPLIRKRVSDL